MSKADDHTSGVIGVAAGLSLVMNLGAYFNNPEALIFSTAASGLSFSIGAFAASVTGAEKLKLKPLFTGCAIGGVVATAFSIANPIWDDFEVSNLADDMHIFQVA